MLTPIAQITCRNTIGNAKLKPNAMTVSSSRISHAPRVSRKRASCDVFLPFEMRHPACEIQQDVRARGIGRIEGVSRDVQIVARVIEHHQRDDEAAQQVDDVQARDAGAIETRGVHRGRILRSSTPSGRSA